MGLAYSRPVLYHMITFSVQEKGFDTFCSNTFNSIALMISKLEFNSASKLVIFSISNLSTIKVRNL